MFGILFNVVNFLSFLSGIAFGLFICFVAAVHYLSDHTKVASTNDSLNKPSSLDQPDPVIPLPSETTLQIQGSHIPQKLSKSELGRLNELIEILDEMNSPLKNIGPLLERIHMNKEQETASIEGKMKTIVEYSAVTRIEKEFQDAMAQLKDHAKQTKLISNFLYDLGKVFSSFSRDVSKLSHTARNNMNKSSQSLDRKEDMIANNWWQMLQIALDAMASDQEDLATIISEELINYSNQIQEEISIIEKRLTGEGNRQFSSLRENLNIFETRLKEREKAKEKLRNTPIQSSPSSNATGTSDSYQRRAQRLKASDDLLVAQTKKLYEIQREFYLLLPRIHSDVQLTILKSIVETQSQLLKLTDCIERIQSSNKAICSRMKTQLTNAASSLVQMIREDGNLLPDSDSSPAPSSFALQIMKQRMLQAGSKGYEMTLQKVLEGLLIQSQLKEISAAAAQAMLTSGTNMNSAAGGLNIPLAAYTHSLEGGKGLGSREDISDLHILEDLGKLDMFQEATACLAASNPHILPELPKSFNAAVGVETCVWFNAFGGRVYRDIANSQYFHKWFCTKLAQMLNKKGKSERPAYIDKFEVTEVTFGELPPLLLNVKWSPETRRPGTSNNNPNNNSNDENEGKEEGRSKSNDEKGIHSPTRARNTSSKDDQDNDSGSEGSGDEEEDDEGDAENEEGEGGGDRQSSRKRPEPRQQVPTSDDNQFYAACTADMAFRSGLKFTVSTKLWINWPRDRYASVPVIFYLDLSELSGRIRFGVERSHSFISFLKNPITRISVRSEVGGDKYKLKDIPQISDFIVKKLKKFIQRRIVYPHAHRFRLIWPRNWWPEGTENLFLPTDQPGVNGGMTASSHPSSPVPLSSQSPGYHHRTPNAAESASVVDNNAENAVPASKQLMEATSKLMNKARAFNFTNTNNTNPNNNNNNNTHQQTASPIPSSNKSAVIVTPVTIGKTSADSAENAMAAKEATENSYQLREARWMQHLKDLSDRSDEIFLPSLDLLSEQEKRRIELLFFLKQKKKKIAFSSSSSSSVSPSNKGGVVLSQPKTRGVSTAHSTGSADSSNNNSNNNNISSAKESSHQARMTRSLSISDFRPVTVDLILEGILDKMQAKISDALDMTRRGSFSGLANDEPIQVVRQHSTSHLKERSNSIHHYRERFRDREKGGGGGEEGNNSGWLTAKSREAKAKFLEFKNKHFGQNKQQQNQNQQQYQQQHHPNSNNNNSNNNNTSSGSNPSHSNVNVNNNTNINVSHTKEDPINPNNNNPNPPELDLDKAYKSAARIGGKIKDFFQKIGDDGEPLGREGGGGHRRPSATATTSSSHRSEGDEPFSNAKNSEEMVRARRGSDADNVPRSADVGFEDTVNNSSHSSMKGSTMKFVASMFRGSNSASNNSMIEGEPYNSSNSVNSSNNRRGRTVSSDAVTNSNAAGNKESRVNAMLSKALSSVRSNAEKDKDKEGSEK